RDDDVVGEGAVAVHAEVRGVHAHVAAPGAAVAAGAADDVSLDRGALPDAQALPLVGRDTGPDPDDIAVELVPDDERRVDHVGGRVVPGLDVQIGATQACPEHPDLHLARTALRLRDVDELQARTGAGLDEGAHGASLPCRCLPRAALHSEDA